MIVALVNHFHVGFTLFATETALRRSTLKRARSGAKADIASRTTLAAPWDYRESRQGAQFFVQAASDQLGHGVPLGKVRLLSHVFVFSLKKCTWQSR
jgi:hypothetical protein